MTHSTVSSVVIVSELSFVSEYRPFLFGLNSSLSNEDEIFEFSSSKIEVVDCLFDNFLEFELFDISNSTFLEGT